MTDIRELDARTVERIAAGEVVERPASVVKELLENSLDAGATRVEVAVEAGGTDGIRVTDDGAGMTEQEVSRAVEKHTTSKITDIGDLEGGVGTLGFRGEALHAIGAVSRLAIRTKPHARRHDTGDSPRGTELTVEGGEVTGVDPVGCPEGTTIQVTDLFYNVPARRKYLKQESTEFAHVNTVVRSYALANPDVAVSLSHGDRETFATSGRGNRRETVMAVYGREVAEAMIDVDDATLPEGPLDGVSGLVSHPETNRATREYLSTFVNGRYVTASAIRDAVLEAYGSQLGSDRYPFAVLDLSVDPSTVDVNVHPRKLEIRFAEEAAVREQVTTVVEETLLDAGLLRSSAPRGRSAPDQATIRPSASGGDVEDSAPDTSADESSPESGTPAAADVDTDGSEDADPSRGGSTPAPSTGGTETPSPESPTETASRSRSASSRSDASPTAQSPSRPAPNTQQTLDGDEVHRTTAFDTVPDLRVLGQVDETYIVAEADDGLVLVDQHAADERINYERLKDRFEGETTTQALAEPVAIELTAGEAALFDSYEDALARLGFLATRRDDRTIEVTTVPSFVADAAGPEAVRDVLADMVTTDGAEQTVEALADELLADMACYPSITGNTSLTEGSVVDLLSALDECENPWACPHGRPVLIHIDADEIDDRFERDYPGHTG